MKLTKDQEHEARKLIEAMTPKQCEAIFSAAKAFTSKPSETESREWKRQEKQRKERALAIRKEHSEQFRTYTKTLLKNHTCPARYELGYDELQTFVKHIMTFYSTDDIYYALIAMYDYGFMRGERYATNQQKKKATLHAANTKNGKACNID